MPPLDFLAAALTMTSTALLAGKRRTGFLFLIAGSILWLAVSLMAQYGGRAVWGQSVASLWTFAWSIYGWRTWNRGLAPGRPTRAWRRMGEKCLISSLARRIL